MNDVNTQIRALANRMKAMKNEGKTFVLMLGAGASFSSGVKPTDQIMEELLAEYASSGGSDPLKDRFDKLWSGSSDDMRARFLKPYLDLEPGEGYAKLAELIQEGFFDLVVTFNFDDLLEKALKKMNLPEEYKLIIRGETKDEEMEKLVLSPEWRIKLLKLHGSLKSSNHFLFTADEMLNYNEPVKSLVQDITKRDIIVCGYAFSTNDLCVINAFSQSGESLWCVNPDGAAPTLRAMQNARRSTDCVIKEKFDHFFDRLYSELLESEDAPEPEKPKINPFKFLESYEAEDKEWFRGREKDTQEVLARLENQNKLVVLWGPEKCGKTSLVRAGLLTQLDDQKYFPVYLRCPPDLEKSLAAEVARLSGIDIQSDDMAGALRQLTQHGASEAKRVLLVLDQFERVTESFRSGRQGDEELAALLKQLLDGCGDNLTLMLVVPTHDANRLLNAAIGQPGVDSYQIYPFDKDEVTTIIKSLADDAGLNFAESTIGAMADRYIETREAPDVKKRYTLTHIQAICHLLVFLGHSQIDDQTYTTVFENNEAALNEAINACDIMSFVEDFPPGDALQIRNILRVVCAQSKDKIAAFIKEHYAELLGTSNPPAQPFD